MQLLIQADGTIRCVYDEAIDLSRLGPLSIGRASHVEPTAAGQWLADLRPVNGPVLGPFPQRSQALAAEAAWLAEHWLIPAAVRDELTAPAKVAAQSLLVGHLALAVRSEPQPLTSRRNHP